MDPSAFLWGKEFETGTIKIGIYLKKSKMSGLFKSDEVLGRWLSHSLNWKLRVETLNLMGKKIKIKTVEINMFPKKG